MLSETMLHSYQQDLIAKAATLPHIGLLLEPGLGKTVTVLTILARSASGRTLVIAPKKVAENVWLQESAKWEHLKHLRVSRVLGTPAQRMQALQADADIYVINLENVAWLVESAWKDGFFNYLVLDESSRFKDPSTQRFKALKKVFRKFSRRIIATGTPSPQGLGDLWSQVAILDEGQRLEKSLTKFRMLYMEPIEKNWHTNVVYKWGVKPGMAKVIQKKIADICFSLRAEDYLKLPRLTNVYHKMCMDPAIRKYYDQMRKEMVSEIDGQKITAATAAAMAGKLLQFTSGAIYDEDGNTTELHSAKVELLESIVEENPAPTMVFYHFKSAKKRLMEAFPYAAELNEANILRWNRGEIKMLIAHPQSGGIGLNLQCNAGNMAHVVRYDLPWSAENYIQANARV
jgi:SNF2 family DNA or RNA helicase